MKPGTKVKVKVSHEEQAWHRLTGIVQARTLSDVPPDDEHDIIVQLWEEPDDEKWEPGLINNHWFSEKDLTVLSEPKDEDGGGE